MNRQVLAHFARGLAGGLLLVLAAYLLVVLVLTLHP